MEANTPPVPSKEELEAALFFAQDMFDRALCPFFPMGQTAWTIKHNEWLSGDTIHLGIRKNDFIGAKDILSEACRIAGGGNIDIGEKKIHIDYGSVKIEVRIIYKHYRVLDFLDPVFYAYETFYLPNPFDHFWRMHSFMH